MKYGLTDIALETLRDIFSRNGNIDEVVLYGSRAKGDFRPFSDVDIVLVGERLSRTDLQRLVLALDDSLLPYRFDVSIFHDLSNPDLIAHIERVGVVLYRKGSI